MSVVEPHSKSTPGIRQLWPLFLIVLLGTSGFAVLIPATPKLIEASPLVLGLIQSISNIVALLGNAALGWYSDRSGTRAAFIVFAVVNTVAAAPLLLGVPAINRVFLSLRLHPSVSGMLGAAAVSDLFADPIAKARMNSVTEAFWAVGFTLGAPIGGRLSRHGVFSNALAAVVVGILSSAVAIVLLPRRRQQPPPEKDQAEKLRDLNAAAAQESSTQSARSEDAELAAANPVRAFLQLWCHGGTPVRALLAMRCCVGMARVLVISSFQLLFQGRFGTSAEEFGYILSVIGVCFVVMTGLAVPATLRHVRRSQQDFLVAGCLCLCLARLGIAMAGSVRSMIMSDIAVAFGGGLVSSSGKALLSDLVPVSQRGMALGAGSAVETASGIIGPAIGGALFQYSDAAPATASAVVCAGAAALSFFAPLSPQALEAAGYRKRKAD